MFEAANKISYYLSLRIYINNPKLSLLIKEKVQISVKNM